MVMRILLISDIHIGSSARCVSMSPDAGDREDTVNEDYFGHLKRFATEGAGPIDYIIISGDIADRAQYEQYEHFDKFIDFAMQCFSVPADRIFFTPGNHDVDWAVLAGGTGRASATRFAARYTPFLSSKVIQGRLSSADGSLTEDPFFCTWEDDDVVVVSINTAAFDTPDYENHPGEIRPETLSKLKAYMADRREQFAGKIKLVLLHHHPIVYENIFPGWKDFSILQCSEDLLEVLRSFKTDLVIHGHRHQPKFQTLLDGSGTQISIMCCGSFSQRFPFYAYERLSNQLHILDVKGRDADTGVLQGFVHSYSFFQTKGWQASKLESDGIAGKLTFGPNIHRSAVKAQIYDMVAAAIEQDASFQVGKLFDQSPELKFVDEELISGVLEEICTENCWDYFGRTLDRGVILPREQENV